MYFFFFEKLFIFLVVVYVGFRCRVVVVDFRAMCVEGFLDAVLRM